MSIYSTLSSLRIPCAYSHFKTDQEPPYIVYIGRGQDTFGADNTWYHRENTYQIEYYFKTKSEATEAEIESTLLAAGYLYEKSEDVYLNDEDLFLIYYFV